MRTIVLVAMLVLANAAMAADSGGYIGASLGASDSPARCKEDLTRRCEGNLFGARGFLGYAFNPTLAVEAGLVGVQGSGGVDLSALASAPLSERVALFGRLGIVSDGDRSDLTYGAGLRFDLEEKAALRLEWQHFGASGGGDFLFLGILSRF